MIPPQVVGLVLVVGAAGYIAYRARKKPRAAEPECAPPGPATANERIRTKEDLLNELQETPLSDEGSVPPSVVPQEERHDVMKPFKPKTDDPGRHN